MIQEMNKIAIIHLYILGFEDELNNFVLGLTKSIIFSDIGYFVCVNVCDCISTKPDFSINLISSQFKYPSILFNSSNEILLFQ